MNRTPEELMRPEHSDVALRRVTGTGGLVAKVPTDFGDLNVAARAAESSDAQMRSNSLSDVMVMMVDDDPMMTDVIQTYLEEAGYRRFVSLNDPLLALDTLRRCRPGLLLLDLMMPGLSGFDILKQMRLDDDLRYTPVIVLTAASDVATKLQALELGATEFLAKPVDASELILRVRNSLVFSAYQDRLANDDLLTGLPNRRAFVARLQAALARAGQTKGALALLHINLDRFKQVNDTLGHSVGDQLLKAVAQRLKSCTRHDDDVARVERPEPALLSRMGGDEFTLLLLGLTSPESASRVARRILALMAPSFGTDGEDLFITPSIGISVFPEDGEDGDTLLRNASAATEYAKSSGRNTYRFYSAELNNASRERLTFENQLRRAIERNELVLHYQPKVDLQSDRVVGAEALLRWNHPEQGLVMPDRFIPVAEESGVIVDIGEWVIEQACAQIAEWRDAGRGNVRVAVNVSRHEMVGGGVVRATRRAMQRHAIARGQLVIELTESMLMDRVEVTSQQLRDLRELGAEVSIDDFGTGYSSMNYLKRFPVDELKIDRSFVAGMPGDKADVAIVRAIIVLAHSLGLRVVAEGVETEAQREALRELACDVFQGYLCSRPVSPQEFMVKVQSINDAVLV
jgi:diguanylate cyclase (GGDEF)-like protein